MKTIKEVIEESTAIGQKLMAETPGLFSVSFSFDGYTVDELREAAKELRESEPSFSPSTNRFHLCHCPRLGSGIYIHIRSKEMKFKIVEE